MKKADLLLKIEKMSCQMSGLERRIRILETNVKELEDSQLLVSVQHFPEEIQKNAQYSPIYDNSDTGRRVPPYTIHSRLDIKDEH